MKNKGPAADGPYWIYMLECSNGAFYTGITVDLVRRYNQHLTGKGGARFTRAFKPIRIAQCWKCNGNRGDAQRLEYALKSLERSEKESLVDDPKLLRKYLKELPEVKKLRVVKVPKV